MITKEDSNEMKMIMYVFVQNTITFLNECFIRALGKGHLGLHGAL